MANVSHERRTQRPGLAIATSLAMVAAGAYAQQDGAGGDRQIFDKEVEWLLPEQYVTNMAWADVDRDGDPDMALVHSERRKAFITIHRNEGGFEFTAGAVYELPEGEVREILLEDFDGDDHPDLVVTRFRGPNSIHRNDGSGEFEITGTLLGLQTDDTNALISNDIDGDGDLDLVVANQGKTKRYLNDGRGGFTAGRAINREGSRGTDVTAGDIDGDGDPDLVIATAYGSLHVHRNYGDGTFDADAPSVSTTRMGSLGTVALADADSDGDLDLFASGRSEFELFRNDGYGGFEHAASLDGSLYLLAGDMDLDGDLDVVTSPARVLRNDGPGEWTRIDNFVDDDYVREATLLDVDGDGDLDLVVIFQRFEGVSIYVNETNNGRAGS